MKKYIIISGGGILVLIFFFLILMYHQSKNKIEDSVKIGVEVEDEIIDENFDKDTKDQSQNKISVVAKNLNIPWDLVFLPDGSMLVTERPGILRKIGKEEFAVQLPEVVHSGEGGLLGIALHPNFKENQWLYLYFTTQSDGKINNMVQRYKLFENNIGERNPILVGIPGASNHNGGRLEFGPDGFLYITTGDAGSSRLAQDKNSLAGKILRLDENGAIPADNPFGNAVYSYGHRNPQGLAWDNQGRLWITEHGRSGIQSGLDELNLIEKGANYGWPTIEGDQKQNGLKSPIRHSGTNTTWAPSGAVYYSGSIFFAGLRGEALYEAFITSQGIVSEILAHFKDEFGRLRDVTIGPDGAFYLLTSNTDGRGAPKEGDDKIIRVPIEVFEK